MTRIIGISAFYHDSAVSLIEDGRVLYAAQEERFTRIKHDKNFPSMALKNLLEFNSISLDQVDYIVFFEKPVLKFERLIETYLAFAPRGFFQFLKSIPLWLKEKLFMKKQIFENLKNFSPKFDEKKIFFSEHHLSHASSAFFPSNFKNALIFTADGVGEWATTSVAIGKNNQIKIMKEIHFPNSLGLLYSAFTFYTGFKVNSGEYKLMGLAPFGLPKYSDLIKKKIINIKNDGSFRMNQKYFEYSTGFRMVNKKFEQIFGKPRRNPESKITKFYMDIAASIQLVTEEIILKILENLKKEFKIENLCLAGGVALNCVANGKILKKKIFKNIWIQPASGDAGGSVGAALAFWYMHLRKKRIIEKKDSMLGSYLGLSYSNTEIRKTLEKEKAVFEFLNTKELIKKTAYEISKGKAIGWFQGRMEFGPRSLGARSIIADPRNPKMQKNLNLKIKFRESFRPFAPSVLLEKVSDWFDLDSESPYMLIVADVKKDKLLNSKQVKFNSLEKINNLRSKIPSVTHVDNSARVQTVNKQDNKLFHDLILEFNKLTNVPILINTSFNIRGEPIVCSPLDALKCFMGTNLDFLVIENFFLDKKLQKKKIELYKSEFDLD